MLPQPRPDESQFDTNFQAARRPIEERKSAGSSWVKLGGLELEISITQRGPDLPSRQELCSIKVETFVTHLSIRTLVYVVLYIRMNLSICKLSLIFGWLTSATNCQAASKEDSDVGIEAVGYIQGHSSGCSVHHCHELHREFVPQ